MRSRTIAAILVSVIGMPAWADTETVDDIVWTFDKSGGVAAITCAKTTSGVKVSADINIPRNAGRRQRGARRSSFAADVFLV